VTVKESDPKQLLLAMGAIRRLKDGSFPVAREVAGIGRFALLKFDDRPWSEIPESAKLAMLKDLVNWEGVTNKDQAHILLQELDVGKLSTEQRDQLIRQADPASLPLPQLGRRRGLGKAQERQPSRRQRGIEPER
jgi:hypothetical protein